MIQLSDQTPFAKGGRRACYRHPSAPDRCIKIALSNRTPAKLKQEDPWWKQLRSDAYYDENLIDLNTYTHWQKKINEQANRHFPICYGLVETDLGPGLEIELILNHDGKIALSGKGYTMENGINNVSQQAIDSLRNFLLDYSILFRDPFPHNLAMQEKADGSLRAIIIDGLDRPNGGNPFQRISSIRKKQIKKKIARLILGFERTNQNRNNSITNNDSGLLFER